MTCISKAERVVGDRDERFLGAKQGDLALHCKSRQNTNHSQDGEQMECEFLLRAHREREREVR